MTSYDNDYNRSLRKKVMGLDIANIGNDKLNAAKTPMHQGGAGRHKDRKKREASMLDDVDFRQHGLKGQGFLDDLLSGLNKAGQVAHQSLDLYDKFNKVVGSRGMGISGGVRRGAESSDVVHPQGITGQMLATAPIAKGKRVRNGKLKGGEKMTGDNYTPNWRQIEAEQAKSGFIGNGYGMSGGDFFSDLLSGINSVAGAVGPIAELAGKFGAGKKQKKQSRENERLAMKLAMLQGKGAFKYGQPALLGMESVKGSGPASDLGIPGLSQIAGLFGLGISGGAAKGADDPAFRTPAPVPAPSSEALASAFLGGRTPSKVSKAEKKMLFLKALADAKMHHELGNLMQGKGLSGSAMPLLKGLGLSGGDFFSDLIGTVGNVANTAMKVAPLFGLGDDRQVGGAYEPLSGAGLTDMPALNATPVRYSYGKMGNIAGMANGAGKPSTKVSVGYLPPPSTQVGVSMSGMGEQSDIDSEQGDEDYMNGGGASGGRMSWVRHCQVYAKEHGCSYTDALKRASASYHKQKVY